MKNDEEHKLQVWFCQLLDWNKIFYFAVPNGDRRGGNSFQAMLVGKRLKAEGVKAGVSDLIIVLQDNVIFVEMKTEQGRQNENQKLFEKKVKELGHNYIVLHNQDECMKLIQAIKDKSDIEVLIEKLNKKKKKH